jgi:hypothetical protein
LPYRGDSHTNLLPSGLYYYIPVLPSGLYYIVLITIFSKTINSLQDKEGKTTGIGVKLQSINNKNHLVIQEYNNKNHLVIQEYNNKNHLVIQEYNNINHLVIQEYNNINHLVIQEYNNKNHLVIQEYNNKNKRKNVQQYFSCIVSETGIYPAKSH